jgi:hypothetical protein
VNTVLLRAKNEMLLMDHSDIQRVETVPGEFLLSLFGSALTEALKAKRFALKKIEATKNKVLNQNCFEQEKLRLVYQKLLQKLKSPLFDISVEGASLSRKRASTKAQAITSNNKPLRKFTPSD